MDSLYDFRKSEVLFVKIEVRVLDLWLDTSSGPKWPKCNFYAIDPKVNKFFKTSWFYWIGLMILDRMRSFLWKLELGLWTYSLIYLLGPSGPNLVSRPQSLGSRNFLRFHSFTGLILWFWKKWDSLCENWS